MGQILSQEEVDALLKGMVGGEVGTSAPGDSARDDRLITRPYDFASSSRISRGKLPVLDAVNDRFSKLFKVRLSNMLRRMVDISYASLESMKFGNLMRSISIPSNINVINSEKLGMNAMIILESKLVIALVDVFFGGRGMTPGYKMQGREFTSIELSMLKKVAEGVVKDMNEAFRPVAETGFVYLRSESNPQFAGIMNDGDQIVMTEFDISIEHVHGSVIVCLPYALVEVIKNRFNVERSSKLSPEPSGEWAVRFKRNLKDVNVEVALELGSAKLTGRQISQLKKGDIIMLSGSNRDELKVKVQGTTKFLGIAGTAGENMAVEIIRESKTAL